MNNIIQDLFLTAAAAALDYAEINLEATNLSVSNNNLLCSDLVEIL